MKIFPQTAGLLRFERGKSLVEILVVVALIALLVAAAVPAWNAYLRRAAYNESVTELRGLHNVLSGYVSQNRSWPQISDEDLSNEEKMFQFYRKELDLNLEAMTHQRHLKENREEAERVGSYIIVPFGPGEYEPFQHAEMTWIMERHNFSGPKKRIKANGNIDDQDIFSSP